MQIKISQRLADELRTWAQDQTDEWPADTPFQDDLKDLLQQLDAGLPTASGVAGIMQLGK